MENTIVNSNIEVVNAWYVTRDKIEEVKACKFQKATTYGSSEQVMYLTERGWKETYSSSWLEYSEIAWTEEEAYKLKGEKMKAHIEYLRKQNEKNQEDIANMQKELEKEPNI